MITVEKLVKSYSHQCVLHGIDMEQQKGEAVVIIGPSGCGKTTFLRCLNQMETLDSGRITIAGITVENNNNQATRADREKQRQLRMRAGMVFQSFNLFPHFTVLRNITEAPMTVKSISRNDADHRTSVMFRSVEDLMLSTPRFYKSARARLNEQLGGAHGYAGKHFGGQNLYLDEIDKNMQYASSVADRRDLSLFRREPPKLSEETLAIV